MTINAFGLRNPSNMVPACAAPRLPTGLAAILRTCLPMTEDLALPNFPSCHAVQVRAKYLGGIHLLCYCVHSHRLQIDALFFPLLRTFFQQLMIVLAN